MHVRNIVYIIYNIQTEMGCHRTTFPWIFANDWQEASVKVTNLLNNESKLKRRQAQVLKWWRTKVAEAQRRVQKAVLQL